MIEFHWVFCFSQGPKHNSIFVYEKGTMRIIDGYKMYDKVLCSVHKWVTDYALDSSWKITVLLIWKN